MARSLAVLASGTAALAAAMIAYRLTPWDAAPIEALAPLIRLAIGLGALSSWTLWLDQRRRRAWARDRQMIVGAILDRPASLRVIGPDRGRTTRAAGPS